MNPEDLAEDLVAIISAVQDGHVDVEQPDDVLAACDLSLWELELGGAA
jgi:hypothetical protein